MAKKLVIICMLVLLSLTDKGTAETRFSETNILRKIEDFDIEMEEGDDDVELLEEPFWVNDKGSKVLVNVDAFGAVGDGVADDTQVNIMLLIVWLVMKLS